MAIFGRGNGHVLVGHTGEPVEDLKAHDIAAHLNAAAERDEAAQQKHLGELRQEVRTQMDEFYENARETGYVQVFELVTVTETHRRSFVRRWWWYLLWWVFVIAMWVSVATISIDFLYAALLGTFGLVLYTLASWVSDRWPGVLSATYTRQRRVPAEKSAVYHLAGCCSHTRMYFELVSVSDDHRVVFCGGETHQIKSIDELDEHELEQLRRHIS